MKQGNRAGFYKARDQQQLRSRQSSIVEDPVQTAILVSPPDAVSLALSY